MFDAKIRPLIDGPLNQAGRFVASKGLSSDQVTITGFCVGMLAVPAIMAGWFWLALMFVIFNRLADGLDGAVARATELSDRGGYLDIVLDFIFYSSIPFAFALLAPETNAIPAVVLLFAFMGTGSSFLAYAIMAAKRGIETQAQGKKSLFYLQGLSEGTETIVFICLSIVFPAWFPVFAYVFAVMCFITTGTRVYTSYTSLK